ncbi:MAG: flagellar basal body protein, partial [Pseudomonadota bacterium]
MSIAALNNALSGLKASQRALGVISDNIANANTEGYVRKVAQPSSVVLDGQGAGVEIGRIDRVVDEFLMREKREETGELKAVEIQAIYYQEVQDLFGQPGDNNSIAALTERLQTALQNFEITPEDSFRAQQVVDAAEDLATKLEDMHFTLQDLRARADNQFGEAVDYINVLLEQIDELNVDIITAEAKGQDAGGLRDKRDVAL